MVQEIRKEVTGLWGKWIQDIRTYSVKVIGLLVSLWILAGVLGIGIMGPVYLAKFFLKGSGSGANRSQVVVSERVTPSIQRYQPYRIQAAQVRNDRALTNGIREARNTASELRSFARAVSALGKA